MKTSLKKGTLYISISSLIFVIAGYLTNVLLGRLLGPFSYGIYGVIITLMTAINLTQTAGLPQAVAKFVAEDESKSESILKSGLIVQSISTLLAALAFFFLAVPIADVLHDLQLVPYIQTSAAVFPFYGIYSIYLNYYNGLHLFKTQAMMNIVYSIAKLISVVILVYFFHVYGAIWGFIISPFIVLLFWFHFPKNVSSHFSIKKLLLFSLPLIAFAICSNLLQSVDLFFVKALLHSNVRTGYYTANQNIAELPFYGVVALASVLFPSISRSVSQNLHDETKKLITTALRFSFLIMTPSILLISATSHQALAFLYSQAYAPGGDALSILVIGSGFFTIFIILSTIISSSGRPGTSALLAFLGVVLSSILCMILIPLYGLNGAALSTTIASFIAVSIAAIVVNRNFSVLLNVSSVGKIILASFLVYMMAKALSVPLLLLPFWYIILFGIYILLLKFMKEITKDDIEQVKSLVPKKMTRINSNNG